MKPGRQSAYFEWTVDVVVGGDVRVLSRLPEALQRRGLHIDNVRSQFMSPHCLNNLNNEAKCVRFTLRQHFCL